MTVKRGTKHNPDMGPDARHWRVTLHHNQRRMTLDFWQGSAHVNPPTVLDVLDCLASDATSYDNGGTFEDWAYEYGYDTDSRKAYAIWQAVAKQTAAFKRLCGDDYNAIVTAVTE